MIRKMLSIQIITRFLLTIINNLETTTKEVADLFEEIDNESK
jgi:hypothetical protein